MAHYVAYHSVDVMGQSYRPDTHFRFYTRKPEALVRGAIGGTAWVIVGEREAGKMRYTLAGAYTPADVTVEGGTWTITGPGAPLRPPLDVTGLPWFDALRREQNNFSLGFNPIRSADVIRELASLVPPSGRAVNDDDLPVAGDMRCLSVKDPWIALLGDGRKRYELRKARTHFRGTVILCSSASPSRTEAAKRARERYPYTPEPLGHALFFARLCDCFPAIDGPMSLEEVTRGACCAPSAGELVWRFEDVRRIATPVPIKGLLGLYRVPPDVEEALGRMYPRIRRKRP